nr:hypothetical protein [Tanacetum cinerariifolium]
MRKTSTMLLSFHILLFGLAISEIWIVKGNLCDTEPGKPFTQKNLCDKDATYYRGKCVDEKCSNNCKAFENGEHGYCRQGEVKLICVCVYDCAKLKPYIPPPPKKGNASPPPKSAPPKSEAPTQHDN